MNPNSDPNSFLLLNIIYICAFLVFWSPLLKAIPLWLWEFIDDKPLKLRQTNLIMEVAHKRDIVPAILFGLGISFFSYVFGVVFLSALPFSTILFGFFVLSIIGAAIGCLFLARFLNRTRKAVVKLSEVAHKHAHNEGVESVKVNSPKF